MLPSLPWLCSCGVFDSELPALSLKKFIYYSLGFPTLLLVLSPYGSFYLCISALLSCNSLYFPVGLSSLGGWSLPYGLTSFTDRRRVGDISICLSFLLVRIEWWLPSFLEPETKSLPAVFQSTENISIWWCFILILRLINISYFLSVPPPKFFFNSS